MRDNEDNERDHPIPRIGEELPIKKSGIDQNIKGWIIPIAPFFLSGMILGLMSATGAFRILGMAVVTHLFALAILGYLIWLPQNRYFLGMRKKGWFIVLAMAYAVPFLSFWFVGC